MTLNKIKILFVHHGTGIGGAPISLLNQIKALNAGKFEVSVAFVRKSNVIELFSDEGIDVSIINSSNLWFSHNESGKIHWRYFYRYFKVYKHWKKTAYVDAPKFLKKQDFDILHLNSHVLTSWAVAGKNLGKKVVLHNREAISKGYFGIRYRLLKSIISKNCDAIINISIDNKNRLGLNENSYVVYNFVKLPEDFKQPMTDSKRKYKVLFLGGMATIKGFQTVVKSLPFLNKNIELQFAGNLSEWNIPKTFNDKLKMFVKLVFFRSTYKPLSSLYNSSNAKVLGLLKEPLPVINNCDLLITPFKIPHFSRPAVEAFAYGKPVIGSDVKGMDEIIDHNENGLLVKANSPELLAAAINDLCKSPSKAVKFGLNGREKAEKVFSPKVNTKKVEDIYSMLMSK